MAALASPCPAVTLRSPVTGHPGEEVSTGRKWLGSGFLGPQRQRFQAPALPFLLSPRWSGGKEMGIKGPLRVGSLRWGFSCQLCNLTLRISLVLKWASWGLRGVGRELTSVWLYTGSPQGEIRPEPTRSQSAQVRRADMFLRNDFGALSQFWTPWARFPPLFLRVPVRPKCDCTCTDLQGNLSPASCHHRVHCESTSLYFSWKHKTLQR